MCSGTLSSAWRGSEFDQFGEVLGWVSATELPRLVVVVGSGWVTRSGRDRDRIGARWSGRWSVAWSVGR
jgi:hypothetical protein